MINAINDFLDEQLVNGFRLIDGNYIIALEERYDNKEDTFYLLDPVLFDYDDSGRGTFKPWLHTDSGEPIALQGDRILVVAPTSSELKLAYYRYNLMSKLSSVMTEKEIDTVVDQLFPVQVDNLDSSVNDLDLSVNDSQFYKWRSQWNN